MSQVKIDFEPEESEPIQFEPIQFEPEQPAEQGWLSKGWNAISEPLWEGPSRAGRAISNSITTPTMDLSPKGDNSWLDSLKKLRAQGQGFAGGAIEGIGDLVSGFTSPIDLAATVATGGSSLAARAGYKGASRGLSAIGRAASAPVAAHGAQSIYNNPTDPMGYIEAAGGMAGMMNPAPSAKPAIRPELARRVASPEEMETVFRGGALRGKEDNSFFTTDKNEAIGYASLAERPEDRLLWEGQLPKGKYPAGNITTGGNIPEDWADIQRAVPNYVVESAFRRKSEPTSVPHQASPEYDQFMRSIDPNWDVETIKLRQASEGRMNEITADREASDNQASIEKAKRDLTDSWSTPADIANAKQVLSKFDMIPESELNEFGLPNNLEMPPASPKFASQVMNELPPAREWKPPNSLANGPIPEPPPSPENPFTARGDVDAIVAENTRKSMQEFDNYVQSGGKSIEPDTAPIMRDDAIDLSDMGDINTLDTNAKPVGLNEAPIIDNLGKSYQGEILGTAARGKPGFSVEANSKGENLIYRGPDGNPIGVAVVNGDTIIDFAVSKTGDRASRVAASKSLREELKARGVNKVEGGMTADAKRVLEKINKESSIPMPKATAANMSEPITPIIDKKSKVITPAEMKKQLEAMGKKIPLLEEEVGLNRPTRKNAEAPIPDASLPIGRIMDKKAHPAIEAMNLPRGIMSSMDFSAPLRQGIGLIHKKEFYTALPEMFKAWASEDGFRASQDAIGKRALFTPRMGVGGKVLPSFAEDAGLALGDLTNINKREEAIMSTWAEKVPGVRPSNRAYTAFLNKVRADTFESLIENSLKYGVDAKTDATVARALAEFVNNATGRGSLDYRFGKDKQLGLNLEPAAQVLNSALFSPRLMASRLKMLNPATYIMGPKQARVEALKSLFAVAAVGNTLTQLGKMIPGATVEPDPTSSDFGKLKIGNTRIDPYGGYQQYIVAANRLIQGRVSSSGSDREYDLWKEKPGPYDPTHMDVAMRFGRGKLHPTLGFAASILMGRKEMTGEKMNFTTANPMENAIAQRFIPILMQDIYETQKENPKLMPFTVPLSAFGMGTQTYGPKQ